MNKKRLIQLTSVISVSIAITACSALGSKKADPRWADYKTWTKISEGRPGTGDPTGFVGTVHKGPKGYRDVFVNKVGLATNQGTAPYKYPVGTVIVKEQYTNKAAWEAQKSPGVTVMLKVSDSATPSADNWAWSDGYTSKAKNKYVFCSACHSIGTKDDFTFTHADFYRKEKK